MSDIIDCRGLSCPEPVIMVRKALQNAPGSKLVVKVSSTVARDNVSRAAKTMGWSVNSEEEDQDFKLVISK